MKTVLKIFKRDFKNIFTNSMAIVLAVGIAVLPSLYAWFNIYANKDPYGSTGNMLVAVAVEDEGYTYNSITINIGEEIKANLQANDSIDWQFVSGKKALNGVKSGKYYAAIKIPKGFSKSLTSIMSSNFKQPEITYYANEKKNAIATKITDKVVQTVQTEVNESFVTTVVDLINKMLGTAVDEANKNGTGVFDTLHKQIKSANQSIDAIDTTLASFKDVMEVADGLTKAMSDKEIKAVLDNTGKLVNDTSDIVEMTQGSVEAVTSCVDDVLIQVSSSLLDAANEIDILSTNITEKSAPALNEILNKCTDSQKKVKTVKNVLIKVNSSLPKRLSAITKIVAKLDEADAKLNKTIDIINSALNSGVSVKASEISQTLTDASSLIDFTQEAYKEDVKPQLSNSAAKLMEVLSGITNLVNALDEDMPDMSKLSKSLSSSIKTGDDMLKSLNLLLSNCKDQLNALNDRLNALDDSDLLNAVVNLTDKNSDELGQFIACPVIVNTEKVYKINNYGSAMAPFYSTLALWVGAVILVAIIKTDVKNKKQLGNVTPLQEYFGRMLIFVFFALIQGLIICLGDLYFLKIQCFHPFKFVLAGCVASVIYTVFIYSLTAALGDIGKALAVIFLVVQIGGSGGTFPIDVTPTFFRVINPYLPFTFVIEAMRECVCGLYENNYWIFLSKLCAYLVIGLAVGTGVRFIVKKPIRFFNKRLEDTGLF